jgi:recombination protein RecT
MAKQQTQTKTKAPGTAVARPIDRFKQELAARSTMLQAMLPPNLPLEKFQSAVIAAVGSNEKLLDCTRPSLMKACIEAAELGLSLNPQLAEADILPVWSNRVRGFEAQFRPRFMGLMKLARQSGDISTITAHVVHDGDHFEYQYGLYPKLEHKPAMTGRGEMTHAYCVWGTRDGEKHFEVMDFDQIMKIRNRSSSKNKAGEVVGPWVTDEEEMWRKTVVRRASKYMPRAAGNFERAVAVDNLREAGVDVRIEDGEIVSEDTGIIDITAVSDEDDYRGGGEQLDGIEKKMTKGDQRGDPRDEEPPQYEGDPRDESAPKPKQEPKAQEKPKQQAQASKAAAPKATKIQPGFGADDGLDWLAWSELCSTAIAAVPNGGALAAWESAHEQLLGQCELADPEIASLVRDALDQRGQELGG